MLTETDIHYLAAILIQHSEDGDVEVELGNRVQDIASGSKRDVDITVKKYCKDGTIVIYKGIEIKDHGRKLDVTHVEQLNQKLQDMPSITEKYIVSATGYTKPAIKKAAFHGITLLEMVPWNSPYTDFQHIQFPNNTPPYTELTAELIGNRDVKLVLSSQDHALIGSREINNLSVFNKNGNISREIPTLDILKDFLLQEGLNQVFQKELLDITNGKPINEHKKDAFVVLNIENLFIHIEKKYIPIKQAEITMCWKLVPSPRLVVSKLLKEVISGSTLAGCAITETESGDIRGISVSAVDKNICILNISREKREKKTIFKQKLTPRFNND